MSKRFEGFNPQEPDNEANKKNRWFKRKSDKDIMRRHTEETIENNPREVRVETLEKKRGELKNEVNKLIEELVKEKKRDDGKVIIGSNDAKRAELEERLKMVGEKFDKSKEKSSFLKNKESRITRALGHVPRAISQRELIGHISSLEEFKNEIQHEIAKQQAWIDKHTPGKDPNISLLIQYVEKSYETYKRPMRDCIYDIGETREYLVNKIRKHIEDNKECFNDKERDDYEKILRKSLIFFDEISPGALFLSDKPKLKPLGHLRRVDTCKELIRHLKSLEKLRNGIIEKVKQRETEQHIIEHTRDFTEGYGGGSDDATTSGGGLLGVPPRVGHGATHSSDIIDPDWRNLSDN